MKSKLFLTVLLLAAITTIGISQEKKSQSTKLDNAAKAERAKIAKLPVDVRSLVGIKGLWVVIEGLKEDAKSAGLTEEQLKTDVELQLRRAGIKVNSKEEFVASKDMICIIVNVTTASVKNEPPIVYFASMELKQKVMLLRSPYTTAPGDTWDKGFLGVCNKSEFAETARQAVKKHMAKFINDYVTANPKKYLF